MHGTEAYIQPENSIQMRASMRQHIFNISAAISSGCWFAFCGEAPANTTIEPITSEKFTLASATKELDKYLVCESKTMRNDIK